MFLEHQISILEWFLKFIFAITGINYILKYYKIENMYVK